MGRFCLLVVLHRESEVQHAVVIRFSAIQCMCCVTVQCRTMYVVLRFSAEQFMLYYSSVQNNVALGFFLPWVVFFTLDEKRFVEGFL